MKNLKKIMLPMQNKNCAQLLRQMAIVDFVGVEQNIDEQLIPLEFARKYAIRMAKTKAFALRDKNPQSDYIALGMHRVVAVGRRILLKPEDENQARQHLKMLSGRRHCIYGGLCLINDDKVHLKVIKTVVKFKNLSLADMDFYIASGQWKNRAGGYDISKIAGKYIAFISGSYSNAQGMDLHTIAGWLERYGLR